MAAGGGEPGLTAQEHARLLAGYYNTRMAWSEGYARSASPTAGRVIAQEFGERVVMHKHLFAWLRAQTEFKAVAEDRVAARRCIEAGCSSAGGREFKRWCTAVVEYDAALTEVGVAWRERASGTHGDRAPHAPGGAAGAASTAAAAGAADDDETQAALRDPDVVEGRPGGPSGGGHPSAHERSFAALRRLGHGQSRHLRPPWRKSSQHSLADRTGCGCQPVGSISRDFVSH